MTTASTTPASARPAAGRRPRSANTAGGRNLHRPLAPLAAALLSMAAYAAGLAAHGTYPFGPAPRAVNDLRHQYVPFHTYLWDLQHGTAQGDLFFNWQSGYGVGFLGDFLTYLTNPFSWLTGLFPREHTEFSVFLVSLFSMGLAAALMTVFLGRLRPGSPWLRALLATGYAVCGWGVVEGTVVPMWTWGLVALPLLGIAADWALTGRRWVLGSLAVALCWFANFYTAAMATIAAALVLSLRLLLADTDWRTRGRVLWRAGTMTGTGLLLAAPAVLVCGLANAQSQPTDRFVVSVATEPLTYLAMLLPGTLPKYPAPNVFAGILALLLVLTLPFQSKVRVKERAGWSVLLLLTAASFVITPTAKLWQGMTLPHGAPFRESFVLSGLMVMAAWICLAHMPRPRALLGGAGLLGVLVLLTYDLQPVNDYALTLALLGGAAVTALLVLYARGLRRPARIAVVGLLAASVFGSTAYAVYGIAVLHDPRHRGPARAQTMTELGEHARAALARQDAWPAGRTDPGAGVFVTNNDSMLVGGQGGSYYSSYVSVETATGLRDLGLGYRMGGRHLLTAQDPVLQALLGIGAVLEPAGKDRVTVRTTAAPPLVTVREPGSDRAYGAPAGSVWARQQAALGAKVYTVPALAHAGGPAGERTGSGFTLRKAQGEGLDQWTTFTARCTPGARAFLYAPGLYGVVRGENGPKQGFLGDPPLVSAGMKELAPVPADGRFSFAVRAGKDGQVLPGDALGCLDAGALDARVAQLKATGAVSVGTGGHSIEAELPKGSTGTAVVATTAPQGWTCSVDGGPSREPVSYQGLLGIPLGGGADRVSCAYTPPGLKAGLAGTALGSLALAGALLHPTARRRLTAARSSTPARPRAAALPRNGT
ncbi:YfhO family protein [Streptomyces sp. NPDC051211]|uniref:YfhO family protein n=1 Tax=Streptomyces sp. NPDC051211 TaxID=3154643 RepID=UPI00344E4799